MQRPNRQVRGRTTWTPRPPKRRGRVGPILFVLVLVGVLLATAAVWTNTFGAGDRFDGLVTRVRLIVAPPPDRPIPTTVEVTEPPASTGPGATPAPGASPTPVPTPLPPREPVDVALDVKPGKVFQKELTNEWCAVAGTQIVLAIAGKGDNSESFQREIAGRIGEWESRRDSHNGGWGPASVAAALDAYGVPGYEVRAYATRKSAMRGAAVALSETQAPVVMLSWRGAHTWIITGYRADADPTIFPDATVSGLYIYDPWYGWVSRIWEAALPPGEFHDLPNLERNFLAWERPEGAYPDRDGKFILVVPTLPRPNL
jgi:hypothetical protein